MTAPDAIFWWTGAIIIGLVGIAGVLSVVTLAGYLIWQWCRWLYERAYRDGVAIGAIRRWHMAGRPDVNAFAKPRREGFSDD